MQANEIDKAKLEELVAAAKTAKYLFWDALSEIEQYAGVDLDDLDMEIEHLDADDVLEMLERQKEEKSTGTTTELGGNTNHDQAKRARKADHQCRSSMVNGVRQLQ